MQPVQIDWLQAVVLGIVQGLTEFLPISSNAHQLLVGLALGWGDPGAAFVAVTQIGTEAAVLLFFRKDIVGIVRALVRSIRSRSAVDDEAQLAWFVAIGSLPIGIIGFLAKDFVEGPARNTAFVGTTLVLGALFLQFADSRVRSERALGALTVRLALILGLGQSLALIPGVSRSGATIATALLLGFSRSAATRYSFLLAIPAVLASGAYELTKIGDDTVAWGPTIVGTVVAFGVGLAVIAWLLRFVQTHTFRGFVIYRLLLGTVVLGATATGLLGA